MKANTDGDNSQSIISVLIDIILGYMKRVSDLLHLAALEAKLAFKTVIFLAIFIFLLGSIITVCWLSILALIFVYLLSLHFSLLSACSIIVVINLLVLAAIFLIMYKIKDNLFFPAISKQLSYHNKAEIKDARIATEN